jgi:hypothetical protein
MERLFDKINEREAQRHEQEATIGDDVPREPAISGIASPRLPPDL